jgi:transcriptional regulator with XRE-family HTH domain
VEAMSMGARLRLLRWAKGMSLREVEKETGVPFSTLHRIETNKGKPFVATMGTLCKFYDVPFTDLLDEDEQEPTPEETDAYLIGLGYNLDKLDAEITALIDELKATARELLAHKKVQP